MSIHIVNSDTHYNDLQNNTLVLNSTVDSNLIRLRTGLNNAFINYENKYDIGLSENNFVINLTSGDNLLSVNQDYFNVYKTLKTEMDVNLYNKFYVSSNAITLHSNIDFILHGDSTFNVDDILTVNSSTVNVNSNVFITNGTLFVNRISSLNENESLSITGASFDSGVIQSLVLEQNISVFQTSEFDSIALDIERFSSNITDIISIKSSNEDVSTLFTMNHDGFMGFGDITPTAPISLSSVNDNIIDFTGNNYGDKMILTSNGHLGLGTDNPFGRLHIKRTDDYEGQNVRNNPILNIDMEYSSNKNISNYLIYDEYSISNNIFKDGEENPFFSTNIYTESSTDDQSIVGNKNMIYFHNSVNTSFNFEKKYDNDDIIPQTNDTIFVEINKEIDYDTGDIIDQRKIDFITNKPSYIFQIVIPVFSKIFPANIKRNVIIQDRGEDVEDVSTLNVILSDSITFGYEIISKTTTLTQFLEQKSYDSSKLYIVNLNNNEQNPTLISKKNNTTSKTFQIKLYFYLNNIDLSEIDSQDYVIKYNAREYVDIPPPDILYISSNNNFISSISANGTLSIGSASPTEDYKLYIDGNSYINTLSVTNISDDMSFGTNNISDVNNFRCNSIVSQDINVQNLTFTTLKKMDTLNISSNLKIITNSDNNINNVNEAVVVTNDIEDYNPAIIIDGKSCNSHLVLRNDNVSYSLNTSNTSFEITYDQINPVNIIKHYKNYEILSLGKNGNINISDDKISIGIPSNHIDIVNTDNETDIKMINYFTDNVKDSTFDVTIYGSVRFCNKSGDTIMQINEDGNVFVKKFVQQEATSLNQI